MFKSPIIALVLVVILALPALASQQTKESTAQQQIMLLDKQWGEAIYRRDTATLGQLLADNLYHVHATGRVADKTAFIDSLEDGMRRHDPIVPMKVQVRLYGDVAVSTGRFRMVAYRKGMDSPMVNQIILYTHVWVKNNEGWKLVVHQATPETSGMMPMRQPGMQPGMMMPGQQH